MEEPRIEIINKEEFQAKIDLITEAFSKKTAAYRSGTSVGGWE